MQYDITAKVVVDRAKETILRRFLGMEPDTIQLIEALPEETVSLKRSDFPLRVTLKDGQEVIVLLEIQTVFSREFLWTLGESKICDGIRRHAGSVGARIPASAR